MRRVMMHSLALFTAALLAAGPALAQRPHSPEGKMAQGLQLSEEQKAKMADLRLEMQKEIAPLKAKLQTLRTDLKLMLVSDNPNMGKIEAKQRQIAEVQSQIAMARIRHQLEVRKLLTPEQRKKFDAAILSGRKGQARRRAAARMRMRMHRMGPRPRPQGMQPR